MPSTFVLEVPGDVGMSPQCSEASNVPTLLSGDNRSTSLSGSGRCSKSGKPWGNALLKKSHSKDISAISQMSTPADRAPSALARSISKDLSILSSEASHISIPIKEEEEKKDAAAEQAFNDELRKSTHSAFSTYSSRVRASSINADYTVEGTPFNIGSVGIIYQATAKKHPKELLAVKMVPAANMEQGEEDVAQMVLSKRLMHPNIVKLIDVVIDTRTLNYFFVMEFYSGFDLQFLICDAKKTTEDEGFNGTRNFSEGTMARFVYEMLEGIAYCHCKRICHRDIRPENYILQYWPKSYTAPRAPLKLIDFGLATDFNPGIPMSQSVGVMYQVSPQVLRQSYSEKCDIWSIGVTIYRLASLTAPFWHEEKMELYKLIQSGPDVAEMFIKHQKLWALLRYDLKGLQHLLTELLTVDEDTRPGAGDILYGNDWLMKRSRAWTSESSCCTAF